MNLPHILFIQPFYIVFGLFSPFALAPKKPFRATMYSSSELSYGSSSSRETPPDIRAPEAWDLEDHASSIWSEDDQSLTSGDEDLQFLAVGELESESEDDRFPWDGDTSPTYR